MFEQAKKDYGKLHIAVNNVGKVLKKSMAEINEAEYNEMFVLNSKAAFFSSSTLASTSRTAARSCRP